MTRTRSWRPEKSSPFAGREGEPVGTTDALGSTGRCWCSGWLDRGMTELALPAADLFEAWADCVREFGDDRRDGSGDWQINDFGPDRATFDALLEICRTEADPTSALPEGHVHCDYYWIVESADGADDAGGTELIGFMAVRHSIDTEILRTLGGHIGYSIRPSRRRQGHAARALGLALDRARDVPGYAGVVSALVTQRHPAWPSSASDGASGCQARSYSHDTQSVMFRSRTSARHWCSGSTPSPRGRGARSSAAATSLTWR